MVTSARHFASSDIASRVTCLQVVKLDAQFPLTLVVPFGVTDLAKHACSAMATFRHFCVFDWAPVLLGAGSDFAGERQHAVAVATLNTVHFFDDIQVSQSLPVVEDVFAATHLRDAVHGKVRELVDRHKQVQHRNRKD